MSPAKLPGDAPALADRPGLPFARRPYKDTVLGGKYEVRVGSAVVVLTGMLHRDPKIWGDDPEAFYPTASAPRTGRRSAEHL